MGDRTPDLMTASHALSQLSYGPGKREREPCTARAQRRGPAARSDHALLGGGRTGIWGARRTRSRTGRARRTRHAGERAQHGDGTRRGAIGHGGWRPAHGRRRRCRRFGGRRRCRVRRGGRDGRLLALGAPQCECEEEAQHEDHSEECEPARRARLARTGLVRRNAVVVMVVVSGARPARAVVTRIAHRGGSLSTFVSRGQANVSAFSRLPAAPAKRPLA